MTSRLIESGPFDTPYGDSDTTNRHTEPSCFS